MSNMTALLVEQRLLTCPEPLSSSLNTIIHTKQTPYRRF